MALTERRLKHLRPRASLYRVADSAGLCIEVDPNGALYWRFRYRFAGKARMMSLSAYPEISLSKARIERDAARESARCGVNPSVKGQADKNALLVAGANTFEIVGKEWLAKQTEKLAPGTFAKAKWMLEELAFPWMGLRPIAEIAPVDVLSVLRRVEQRGNLDTAHRLRTANWSSVSLRCCHRTGRAGGAARIPGRRAVPTATRKRASRCVTPARQF